ncbi:porin [Cupriavidus sp. 30B13]|uniref:porin n=1 Tax=Cupriavidus sp. 30B13 TaxID=3384241 RepID=UPI003B903D2D
MGAAIGTALACADATAGTMQLFGVVDASIEYAKGSDSVVRMREGQQAASRWGIRGIEDLGGGLKANFLVESGFNIDNGMEFFGSNRLFGRQAYVGLSNGWGEFRLGRQYTPSFYALLRLDPFLLNGAISPFNLLSATASQGTGHVAYAARFDNAVQYFSPTWGGFSFGAAVAPGEVPGSARSGLNFGMNAAYEAGNAYAFYSYQGMYSGASVPVDPTLTSNHFVGGSYRFKAVELGLLLSSASSERPDTRSARHYGVTLNWTVTQRDTFKAAALKRQILGGGERPLAVTVGWDHDLSKRTTGYVRAVYVHNSAGGSVTNNSIAVNPGSGDDAKSVSVGLRHRF